MKRHFLISIFLLILIISCKQKTTLKVEIEKDIKKNEKLKQKLTIQKIETEDKVKKNTVLEQYIENDSLVSLLEFDLNKISLSSKFEIKKKPKTNTFDKTIIDTLKTLTFDKTKIYSYRTKTWESIYLARIENTDFMFFDSINIGTKKEIFENLIRIELKTNFIKIGNLEQTSIFYFQFDKGILKTIDYEGHLD